MMVQEEKDFSSTRSSCGLKRSALDSNWYADLFYFYVYNVPMHHPSYTMHYLSLLLVWVQDWAGDVRRILCPCCCRFCKWWVLSSLHESCKLKFLQCPTSVCEALWSSARSYLHLHHSISESSTYVHWHSLDLSLRSDLTQPQPLCRYQLSTSNPGLINCECTNLCKSAMVLNLIWFFSLSVHLTWYRRSWVSSSLHCEAWRHLQCNCCEEWHPLEPAFRKHQPIVH